MRQEAGAEGMASWKIVSKGLMALVNKNIDNIEVLR